MPRNGYQVCALTYQTAEKARPCPGGKIRKVLDARFPSRMERYCVWPTIVVHRLTLSRCKYRKPFAAVALPVLRPARPGNPLHRVSAGKAVCWSTGVVGCGTPASLLRHLAGTIPVRRFTGSAPQGLAILARMPTVLTDLASVGRELSHSLPIAIAGDADSCTTD